MGGGVSEWLVVDWLAGQLRFEPDHPLINQIGPLLDSECPSQGKVGPHASRGVSNINTSGSSVQAGFKLNHVWLAFDQMGKNKHIWVIIKASSWGRRHRLAGWQVDDDL